MLAYKVETHGLGEFHIPAQGLIVQGRIPATGEIALIKNTAQKHGFLVYQNRPGIAAHLPQSGVAVYTVQ